MAVNLVNLEQVSVSHGTRQLLDAVSLGVSEGGNASEIINNPVNASNVMYAFHYYAASHKDNYRAEVERAAASIPLFVTEFGTVSYTGNGAVDVASSNAWFDLLDRLCGHHHDLKTIDNWALAAGRGKRPFVPPGDPRHPRSVPAAA